MSTLTVEAIYQGGVIKPITRVPLRENERLKLRIERRLDLQTPNTIHLRGIWKSHLTAADKGDWVSDTVATIRRESGEKVARLAREIEDALHDA
jgi:predicted DNA-binding antitoxin AbrB/MazE fold protein